MTANITPVSEYDAATLTRAVDGEDAYMDGGSAPLGTVLQKFANRTLFARDAVVTSFDWDGELSLDPGGSNSSFTVRVGAISSVVVLTSGVYTTLATTGTTFGASKISGGGNLANSTWYYIYLYSNTGTIDWEISTTAPNALRRYKNGDTSRRYVGCFRTDGSGNPFPFRAQRGRYLYRRGGISSVTSTFGSNGLRAVSGNTVVSVTSLDLSSRLPPHARVALLQARISAISTGTSGSSALNLYSAGDSTSIAVQLSAAAAANGDTISDGSWAEIELTSAQLMGYNTTNSTDALSYTIDVMGWLE